MAQRRQGRKPSCSPATRRIYTYFYGAKPRNTLSTEATSTRMTRKPQQKQWEMVSLHSSPQTTFALVCPTLGGIPHRTLHVYGARRLPCKVGNSRAGLARLSEQATL